MRQIDNMTPQEIETLALKGMTADRRTIPAEKPTAILTESDAWEDDYRKLKAHADNLAEAINMLLAGTPVQQPWAESHARAVVKQWEDAR